MHLRILILLLLMSLHVERAHSQAIDVSLPTSMNVAPMGSIMVPIEVSDLSGRNILAFQIVVSFDSSVVRATGASSDGAVAGSFGPPTVNTTEAGKISIGGFGTAPLSGSGIFINLNFEVIGLAGDSTLLKFDSVLFNSGQPPANASDGKLVVAIPTGVEKDTKLPDRVFLGQNYPNPFNPETTIVYTIPEASFVQLSVYNILGERVIDLVKTGQVSGEYAIRWDGLDREGDQTAAGIYLARLTTYHITKTIAMLKVN